MIYLTFVLVQRCLTDDLPNFCICSYFQDGSWSGETSPGSGAFQVKNTFFMLRSTEREISTLHKTNTEK